MSFTFYPLFTTWHPGRLVFADPPSFESFVRGRSVQSRLPTFRDSLDDKVLQIRRNKIPN